MKFEKVKKEASKNVDDEKKIVKKIKKKVVKDTGTTDQGPTGGTGSPTFEKDK